MTTTPTPPSGAIPILPATQSKIMALENALYALVGSGAAQPVEAPLMHHFSEGLYGREIFMPAGAVLTGRIHKFRALNILLSGEVSVLTDAGTERMVGPRVWVSPPGTKRALYIHTDCRWLTVHATTKTDIAEIEADMVAWTYDDYLQHTQGEA
jgi:quercetin dioxygenase-like cupin family protein